MKKSLIVACLLGFAVPALAGGNSNNSGGDNTANGGSAVAFGGNGGAGGQGGAGGAGGQGGTGIGIAGASAGAISGSSSSVKNDVDVRNTNVNNLKNTNNNLNLQGQQQAQGQSQSTKNSNNASQSTNLTVEGDTYKQERPVVSTAYAPTVFPTAPCMGSSSIGASGSLLSISGGTTWTSNECMILETARGFDQAGYKADGLYIRCQGKYAANAPSCKAIREAEDKGETAVIPTPTATTTAKYDATDNFVKSNFLGVSY